MANTFLTPDFVVNAAQDAALILSANLVASNLVSRQFEQLLAGGVPTVGPSGGSVDVKIIGADTANTQNHRLTPGALTVSDVTETSVRVEALHYVYVKKKLNTKEKTYELDNFSAKYTMPAMVGIANEIDSFMIRKIAGGFARNISGTAGTAASSTAHILACRKVLQDNLVPLAPRVAIIGTTSESSFLGLDHFVNRDYGEDGATALRQAAMSTRYGINWFVDQNVGTFSYGYTTGTILSNGALTSGTTATVDGFTAATGTVNEGARFKISGDTQEYVVTADTDIVGNAAALPVYPAIGTGWADGAAVTFQTAHTEDVVFHPGMVAGAVIAPAALMSNSAVGGFDGLSIRVSFESTTSDSTVGAADFVLYDVYVGAKVTRPEGGAVLQG
tara:strand:- start:2110 stop:3276 length:1167 start_codon:yes stop_codon:yes gene_type:complete